MKHLLIIQDENEVEERLKVNNEDERATLKDAFVEDIFISSRRIYRKPRGGKANGKNKTLFLPY